MKKILILVNHDIVIYNFRKELVQELINRGFEVYISSPNGSRIQKLIDIGIIFIETKVDRHGKNPFMDFKLYRKYNRIINDIIPDIVLTYTIKPNIYGGFAAKKNKIPYIANITGLGSVVEKSGFLQSITLFLYKKSFKYVKRIFVQNNQNKDFFSEKNIYPNKTYLIPGSGVNIEEFYPLDYPDSGTIEFVFISRIMKEKGIDQYLAAAKYFHDNNYNLKFHICGFLEEDYYDIIQEYTDREIVIYHGLLSDIKEILLKTHCTIHPSYYPEGISNVLLESSACARPIITTDKSGCKEVIDDGKNGYLIKQKCSIDLIEKIKIFIKLDRKSMISMGLYGREKIKSKFNRKIVVKEYMKIINQIMGVKNGL